MTAQISDEARADARLRAMVFARTFDAVYRQLDTSLKDMGYNLPVEWKREQAAIIARDAMVYAN